MYPPEPVWGRMYCSSTWRRTHLSLCVWCCRYCVSTWAGSALFAFEACRYWDTVAITHQCHRVSHRAPTLTSHTTPLNYTGQKIGFQQDFPSDLRRSVCISIPFHFFFSFASSALPSFSSPLLPPLLSHPLLPLLHHLPPLSPGPSPTNCKPLNNLLWSDYLWHVSVKILILNLQGSGHQGVALIMMMNISILMKVVLASPAT